MNIQVVVSFLFLMANLVILVAVLAMNRHGSSRDQPAAEELPPGNKLLPASDILGWEFEYARTTASEAMQDRHLMVNFYLLASGIVITGVITILGGGAQTPLPQATPTLLLWLLCGVGWLYFLKIVRLRQAWRDSAKTMNRIKDFYIQHSKEFEPGELRQAFRWQAHTLPSAEKPWTVFHYSVMLIALFDSVAFVVGGLLLGISPSAGIEPSVTVVVAALGTAFFGFHMWMYNALLKEPRSANSGA